ncbi:hypothetical protein ACIQVL_51485 [Streptomyces sp. NPDC090499]|uniref:hypothetical protein n=1 Tax=Streptomyces sp. NPDC090499 TaxID=3365965 RepID=UPI00382B2686
MTPPTTRTWSRRGHTPVVRVRGRSRRRLSVAALACYKTGEPSRLIYRPCPDARPDGRKSFSWKDYRDLIQTAHQQLGGPIVLVWDNLNTHLTAGMHRYIADYCSIVLRQVGSGRRDRSALCPETGKNAAGLLVIRRQQRRAVHGAAYGLTAPSICDGPRIGAVLNVMHLSELGQGPHADLWPAVQPLIRVMKPAAHSIPRALNSTT